MPRTASFFFLLKKYNANFKVALEVELNYKNNNNKFKSTKNAFTIKCYL